MAAPPLGYGVQLACAAMRWPECLDVARAAERRGYASVWLPDHYAATPDGLLTDTRTPLLDGLSTLGALAASTERVRLGPLVASNTFRHPAILAKVIASLDHVSGGRMELGMGAGWFEWEHASLGIPFPPLGERLRALEEAIRVVRALWTQEAVDFDGRFYTLRGAVSDPKPLQRPGPPLVVGASGEKVALRNAARYADHWNTYCPPDLYARKRAVLDDHCAALGRAPGEIARSVMVPLYLAEDELVKAKLGRWGGTRASREWFLVGSDDEIGDRIGRFVEAGAQLVIVQVDRESGNAETLEAFADRFF